MGNSPTTAGPLTIAFKRQLPFRAGAAGIEISSTKDPAVLQAIVLDDAFPGTTDISLGNIAINAQAGQDLTFATGKGNVSFRAQAAASSGLGVYFSPANLLTDFQVEKELGFSLPDDPASYYMLFHWGFDVGASASGAVAMGAPSVTFSADAGAGRNYAVIRQFLKKTGAAGVGARTAIEGTVDSWALPSLILDEGDLPPTTWIYSEVDGKFKGNVGVSYGYDFNWVREARFAGLKGDIGLKIQLGLSASLGFEISGRFAVVVSRESSQPVVRVRVFRQPSKGFNFALNAGATVQPSTGTFLPESLDDFIKAMLGTYAPQLLKDLHALEDWASGKVPLSGALANLSTDYMLKLVGNVYQKATGRPFNPDQDFDRAKSFVMNFLNTWGGLDSKLASLLWKLVPKPGDQPAADIFTEIGKITDAIANGTQDSFRNLLNTTAAGGGFFSSPLGQWLETLAWGNVLEPATNAASFQKLKDIAKDVSPFLTAGDQNAVLGALHGLIEERFKLSAITDAVQQKLDQINEEWLRAKIADFLEQKVFGFEELKKIDQLIQTIRQKAQDFYSKGLKALNTSYSFSLAATYQTLETTTALLDAEFDFGDATASRPQLQQVLKTAIGGDFSMLLLQRIPGVRLNRAALSHSIERHTHLELKMPFYFSTIDHINKSLAEPNAMDVNGQRVVIYQLDSSDERSKITNRGGNDSHLVMGAKIPAVAGNETRVFGEPAFTYSYSYRQASRDMRRDQLQYQLKPYVDQYVGKAFASGAFDLWLSEMDRALHLTPTDRFGYALLSIDVSLPSAIAAAWLNASAEEKTPSYMDMSIALQGGLKSLVPLYYFTDASKYNDIDTAYVLLGYQAMPATTSVRLDGNQLFLNTCQSVYWDWMDPNLRQAVLRCSLTEAKLRAILPAIFQRLQNANPAKSAFYAPGDGTVKKIRDAVSQNDGMLKNLLFTEAEIVHGALKAGQNLAKFREKKGADVKAATRALAAFGSTITETFNARVSSIYGGDAVRPLGTQLFVAAAQALSGDVQQASALFRFLALKPDANFQPGDFLQGQMPQDGILIQQSIVNA
jgi:hypothetical protein